jgi:hypothetical protein
LIADKLYFIYVAKNEEWEMRQKEDWDYVESMSRFFRWWAKRYFEVDMPVEADILPVIPGRLFDRMSLAYLIRDHEGRGNDVLHFYLAYFKPFWTDCNTEGYTAKNLGVSWWQRPAEETSESERLNLFVEKNCPRVSHILAHELLRVKGKTKKQYFGDVHDLWDKHIYDNLPFLYFDSHFKKVNKASSYKFVTLDPGLLST